MDVSKQIIELNNLVGLDNFLNTINTHTPQDSQTEKLLS